MMLCSTRATLAQGADTASVGVRRRSYVSARCRAKPPGAGAANSNGFASSKVSRPIPNMSRAPMQTSRRSTACSIESAAAAAASAQERWPAMAETYELHAVLEAAIAARGCHRCFDPAAGRHRPTEVVLLARHRER